MPPDFVITLRRSLNKARHEDDYLPIKDAIAVLSAWLDDLVKYCVIESKKVFHLSEESAPADSPSPITSSPLRKRVKPVTPAESEPSDIPPDPLFITPMDTPPEEFDNLPQTETPVKASPPSPPSKRPPSSRKPLSPIFHRAISMRTPSPARLQTRTPSPVHIVPNYPLHEPSPVPQSEASPSRAFEDSAYFQQRLKARVLVMEKVLTQCKTNKI